MAEYRFFESTNPYWSKQTQAGGAERDVRLGWCAAASAIWCSNILVKGKKLGDSDPDKGLAGILQVKYRWDPAVGGQDALNLLGHVGLDGEIHDDLYRDGALQYMGSHPGVYWFFTGAPSPHVMGADTRPGRYAWYDIESGLYAYDGLDEMKERIQRDYPSTGRVWMVVKCSL